MPQGKIKRIVADRGFGFISSDEKDVFFHHTAVVDQKFDELQEGQAVTYDIVNGPDSRGRDKGPRAMDVKPVEEE
ncbi:MAG: cold-shock protein [Thermoguttaceae bacterium]